MATNLNNSNELSKRRIYSKEECLHDLKDELSSFFEIMGNATGEFNQMSGVFNYKTRNFEATLFQTCFWNKFMTNFPDNWKVGKYKRLWGNFIGVRLIMKKMNRAGFPMNTKTNNVEKILNQQQGELFKDDSAPEDAIVYLGYNTNRFGLIESFSIRAIDGKSVLWVIRPEDLDEGLTLPFIDKGPDNSPNLDIQEQIKPTLRKKKADNHIN